MNKRLYCLFACKILFLVFLTYTVLLQGCEKDSREIEKTILAYDSSFQETLDRRNSIRKGLDSKRIEYLRKTRDIENKISNLREKKMQSKREYVSTVEKIKRQIQPVRKDIQKNIILMRQRYRQKAYLISDVEKDIKEITLLINKKDNLALTREEIQTWNDRLSALIEKKELLTAEKNKLKKEIEISKYKCKVLVI